MPNDNVDVCWPTVQYDAKCEMKKGQKGMKTATAGAGNRSQSQERLRWLFFLQPWCPFRQAMVITSWGLLADGGGQASAAFQLCVSSPVLKVFFWEGWRSCFCFFSSKRSDQLVAHFLAVVLVIDFFSKEADQSTRIPTYLNLVGSGH